jgi:hypothetical protein
MNCAYFYFKADSSAVLKNPNWKKIKIKIKIVSGHCCHIWFDTDPLHELILNKFIQYCAQHWHGRRVECFCKGKYTFFVLKMHQSMCLLCAWFVQRCNRSRRIGSWGRLWTSVSEVAKPDLAGSFSYIHLTKKSYYRQTNKQKPVPWFLLYFTGKTLIVRCHLFHYTPQKSFLWSRVPRHPTSLAEENPKVPVASRQTKKFECPLLKRGPILQIS